MPNIAKLLSEQESLLSRINTLVYGSVEIRVQNEKKYIYVHYRNDGILSSKYVGEYTIDLYNLILENNKIIKEYKKRLRQIKKELDLLQYESLSLNDKVKLNIDLARRNLVDSIYKQAKLEGVATTYLDTETIVNGGKVKNMTASDISKVVNLKHAWDFILSEGVISCSTSYPILCQINELVEEGFSYNAGKIRSVPVTIGGSRYIPPLPFEPQVKEDISNIIRNNSSYDTAIELMLYVMKKQLFLDGNKRTAVIFANHYLISNGMGLIIIPAEQVEEFKLHLINYYEDINVNIKDFIYSKCLVKLDYS